MANTPTIARPSRLRTHRHALAIAVGMVVSTSAFANQGANETANIEGFRLLVSDVISSSVEQQVSEDDSGRLSIDSLVQSHPNPAYLTLQEKFESLPPFTEAQEEAGERYIAEASAAEKLVEEMWALAGEASSLVADISTEVRFDDRSDEDGSDYTTTLATINPTFQYQVKRRKWKLEANYDYVYGHYSGDRDEPLKDHKLDAVWTYRPVRGRELTARTLIQNTSDRQTNDPVTDFDGSLDPIDSNYQRRMVDLRYKHGSLRDRGRWEVYGLTEQTETDSSGAFLDYNLDRNAVGGSYSWQLRRQLAVVGEARRVDFNYEESGFDYVHNRWMIGADLVLGRRLRTNLRVGLDSIDGENKDTDDVSWRGVTEWAIRRKSIVQLETGRELYNYGSIFGTDAASFNNTVTQDWIRTSWREKWSPRFSTETTLTYRHIDGEEQDDDATQLQITANYQFTNRLNVALDAAYTQMDRTFEDDFDRHTITLRADYSL